MGKNSSRVTSLTNLNSFSLERCLTVLNGGVAEYIPIAPQSFMWAVETAGMKIRDVTRSGASISSRIEHNIETK